jgi:excisionase family DNA binding protein
MPSTATPSIPASPVDSPAKLFKTKQAAEFLGVSEPTLRNWVRDGLIPEIRIGKKLLRFDPNDLIAVVTKVHSERAMPTINSVTDAMATACGSDEYARIE